MIKGGKLAEIESLEENDYIMSLVEKFSFGWLQNCVRILNNFFSLEKEKKHFYCIGFLSEEMI